MNKEPISPWYPGDKMVFSENPPLEEQEKIVKERWKIPIPKPDWGVWWKEYLTKYVCGFICGGGAVYATDRFGFEYAVVFLILPFIHVSRQALEFMRRNDTPGRDLEYFVTGMYLGIISSVLYLIAT